MSSASPECLLSKWGVSSQSAWNGGPREPPIQAGRHGFMPSLGFPGHPPPRQPGEAWTFMYIHVLWFVNTHEPENKPHFPGLCPSLESVWLHFPWCTNAPMKGESWWEMGCNRWSSTLALLMATASGIMWRRKDTWESFEQENGMWLGVNTCSPHHLVPYVECTCKSSLELSVSQGGWKSPKIITGLPVAAQFSWRKQP